MASAAAEQTAHSLHSGHLNDGGSPRAEAPVSIAAFALEAGERVHHVIDGAGHNLPEEAPREFADAMSELVTEPALR